MCSKTCQSEVGLEQREGHRSVVICAVSVACNTTLATSPVTHCADELTPMTYM